MNPQFPFSTLVAAPVVLLLSVSAVAAPSVDEVAMFDGRQINISGAGFGQGPTVVLYDSFKDAESADGQLTLKPEVGSWYEKSTTGTLSSGSQGVQSRAVVAKDTEAGSGVKLVFGIQDNDGVHGLKHFQEVFFSFDIKDEGAYPGTNDGNTGFADSSSTKDAWMMFGNRGDNTVYSVSQGVPSGHDLYIPAWTGGMFLIAGNNSSLSPGFYQGSLKDHWSFNNWNTMMFHASLDPEDPYGTAEGFFSFMNENLFSINTREGNFMEDQTEEGVSYPYWDRIKFNAWTRSGDNPVKRLYDNIYVAVGDNANARVVIADAEDLNNATRLVHLLPITWEDDRILAEIPELDGSREQFVHVITAGNEFSAGIPLCVTCPNPPSELTAE